MRLSAMTDELTGWANSPDPGSSIPTLDREQPATLRAIQDSLRTPAQIGVVERIEELAKSLWSDVLTPGAAVGRNDAVGFARFFAGMGFLFKYKPYGVKIASPFGYSLFDLHDGQGFSFQIHLEPKWEAFHILAVKRRSLLYISSVPEWEASGEAWARGLAGTAPMPSDPLQVWHPAPGDTLEITEPQTVHAALGCVLEEFAGCSVDAVERLYDPYSRAEFALPDEHLSPRRLLLRSRHQGLPVRLLRRVPAGWQTDSPPADGRMIDVRGEMWGGRVSLAADRPHRLDGDQDFVTVVVPASEMRLRTDIEGAHVSVETGTFACLPPGLEASITADRPGTVAVHRVARRLVQADWSR